MRIALIADAFPPMRSSGAVQLRDLSREFVRQGHQVTVLTPEPGQSEPWTIEDYQGVEVVRLRALKTRDTDYARRAIGEMLMPFLMLRNFRSSPAAARRFDAVLWYSPTIFLGPIVKALKRQHGCPSYLIIRDIFPEWAADMGLMRRGLAYRFFKAVANFQYSVADVIGVQAKGNVPFFDRWARGSATRVEVLQNWLSEAPDRGCSIDIAATPLAGRRIFVYAGNMGVAQGMGRLLDLAERLKGDKRIGFVFVGRGSAAAELKDDAGRRGLDNILFFDEIHPDEIAGLYAQCDVGLVALDPRHNTHNIPGKFISYMHAGLPVLASINAGNDLADLVETERVGRASTDPAAEDLPRLALEMLRDELSSDTASRCCTALARRLFSTEAAVRQIVAAIKPLSG
jgi:glycosyltransferase involved in cell wall biosynthesis